MQYLWEFKTNKSTTRQTCSMTTTETLSDWIIILSSSKIKDLFLKGRKQKVQIGRPATNNFTTRVCLKRSLVCSAREGNSCRPARPSDPRWLTFHRRKHGSYWHGGSCWPEITLDGIGFYPVRIQKVTKDYHRLLFLLTLDLSEFGPCKE